MNDLIVNTDARRSGKAAVTEKRRCRPVREDTLLYLAVDMRGGNALADIFTAYLPGDSGYSACIAHPDDLFTRFQGNHIPRTFFT